MYLNELEAEVTIYALQDTIYSTYTYVISNAVQI